MIEKPQNNTVLWTDTRLFRLALISLSWIGIFLFIWSSFVIDLVLKGSLLVGGFAIILFGAFTFVSTLAALEPRMEYRFRFVGFVVGVAAALPLMFAIVFAMMYVHFPNCISFPDGEIASPATFRYFSFTTFTTLGYGEITPSGFCRGISSFEAFLGMTYVGVLVAVISEVISNRRSAIRLQLQNEITPGVAE